MSIYSILYRLIFLHFPTEKLRYLGMYYTDFNQFGLILISVNRETFGYSSGIVDTLTVDIQRRKLEGKIWMKFGHPRIIGPFFFDANVTAN